MSDLASLSAKVSQNISDLLEDHKPMEVAAIMTTQALAIYKTILTEDEFNLMVDMISESRDRIFIFEPPNVQ